MGHDLNQVCLSSIWTTSIKPTWNQCRLQDADLSPRGRQLLHKPGHVLLHLHSRWVVVGGACAALTGELLRSVVEAVNGGEEQLLVLKQDLPTPRTGVHPDVAQVQLVQALFESVQTLRGGARVQDLDLAAGTPERLGAGAGVPAEHGEQRGRPLLQEGGRAGRTAAVDHIHQHGHLLRTNTGPVLLPL